MAQTFQRVNKTRKLEDEVDNRKSFKNKQNKNLDKHRNSVYSLIRVNDDYSDLEDDDEFDD